jgi:HEAT repeat protein
MKLRRTKFTAVCMLLLLARCASSQVHVPLDIQISIPKDTVLLGEPVWVDVHITNRSAEPLHIDTGNECFGNRPLKVQVPAAEPGSGERVSCRVPAGSGGSCPFGLPPLVFPGETIVRRYVLSGDFRITHPGSYNVLLENTISYAPVAPAGAPQGASAPKQDRTQTASVQVTLDVQPAAPEKLLAIEEELAQKAAEPAPDLAQPPSLNDKPPDANALRAREIRFNIQLDALMMSQAIAEGLAMSPAAGLEPVFRTWAKGWRFGYYGLIGLKRLKTPAAREALASIANSTERQGDSGFQSTRSQTVDALADMGDKSYLPLLEKLTRDSDVNVRRSAIAALGLLGGGRELPLLTTLAHNGVTEPDRYVAIGAIGDTDSLGAVPILIDLAALPDSEEPDTSYFGLLTLTHLQFPAPAQRPVAEVQRAWLEFWRSHEPGAQAYSRYDCPNPAVLRALK